MEKHEAASCYLDMHMDMEQQSCKAVLFHRTGLSSCLLRLATKCSKLFSSTLVTTYGEWQGKYTYMHEGRRLDMHATDMHEEG